MHRLILHENLISEHASKHINKLTTSFEYADSVIIAYQGISDTRISPYYAWINNYGMVSMVSQDFDGHTPTKI